MCGVLDIAVKFYICNKIIVPFFMIFSLNCSIHIPVHTFSKQFCGSYRVKYGFAHHTQWSAYDSARNRHSFYSFYVCLLFVDSSSSI